LSGGEEPREAFGFFSEHDDLQATICDLHLTDTKEKHLVLFQKGF
jgi:hypothetical protein